MKLLGYLALALLLGVLDAFPISAQANETTWRALQKGGAVILMRHAVAPGIGDPAEFERGRCETQRNLSERGRAQARAIGRDLRERNISVAAVYASQWCRALDTARLMDIGDVKPAPWLDSFFRERSDKESRTRKAREHILDWQGPGNLLLVTHQVNISALVGSVIGAGEMIVVRPTDDKLQVLGRLSVGSY
ncbi:histidine phosphatase family protein [Chromohalobacter sp. HP20-39]|uniref:histidine phosphatase family protein n=1 Tax=Chromohalobacter sp. HP20-39 TaxID=3079306 RepID=UPI00294B15C2|nr:histidine phosphatase family protein [Chromohalobacter sp. HP20-39]MDV6318366.1 histidine phosphatase family protein [Chromohalobacter sp. HP20-39]